MCCLTIPDSPRPFLSINSLFFLEPVESKANVSSQLVLIHCNTFPITPMPKTKPRQTWEISDVPYWIRPFPIRFRVSFTWTSYPPAHPFGVASQAAGSSTKVSSSGNRPSVRLAHDSELMRTKSRRRTGNWKMRPTSRNGETRCAGCSVTEVTAVIATVTVHISPPPPHTHTQTRTGLSQTMCQH